MSDTFMGLPVRETLTRDEVLKPGAVLPHGSAGVELGVLGEPVSDISYRAFQGMHRRLTQMIADGKGDTQEANDLRELMEKPWYAMTEEDRERSRKEPK